MCKEWIHEKSKLIWYKILIFIAFRDLVKERFPVLCQIGLYRRGLLPVLYRISLTGISDNFYLSENKS